MTTAASDETRRPQRTPKPNADAQSTRRTAYSPSLVNGITKENWAILAEGFMHDRSGVGFPLALARVRNKHGEYDPTVQQWGAWLHYLRRKGIPLYRYMRARSQEVDAASGEPNAVWTAPAEWPHLFDMEAEVQDDMQAGAKFAAGYRPPSIQMAEKVKRIAQVQRLIPSRRAET